MDDYKPMIWWRRTLTRQEVMEKYPMATEKDKTIAEIRYKWDSARIDTVQELIEQTWDAARADAIEECAQAQCGYCEAFGPPKERDAVLTANGHPLWHEANGLFMECKAAAILSRKQEEPR